MEDIADETVEIEIGHLAWRILSIVSRSRGEMNEEEERHSGCRKGGKIRRLHKGDTSLIRARGADANSR